MSVQFGRWHFKGSPVAPDYLNKAAGMLALYAPDGEARYSAPGLDIIYRSFHTSRESRREQQPHSVSSGGVLTWDGRLDNREELLRQLTTPIAPESADVTIVAAAYEQWGTKSFAKLVGDWALSVWEPGCTLILAKDFLGTRHLYYTSDQEQVTWSTVLAPLVLLAGKTFQLEEEYIAGWFAFFPAVHLTPYVGIHAVPPATFVSLRPGRAETTKYWNFDPRKRIHYATDGEYEEHFRSAFGDSVRRRLRSDAPVLAELSGGMDSSSIVCAADQIIAQGTAETPRLDTISYYNDAEPNWNERPYFAKVEEGRGRAGCHIDVGREDFSGLQPQFGDLAVTPGSCACSPRISSQFAGCLEGNSNRVVLSGLGGDEVTGGVPTPIPELMDCVAQAHFRKLTHRLKDWALCQRKPWFHLLAETMRGFFSPSVVGVAELLRPPGWLCPRFVDCYRDALSGYPSRVTFFGTLPSFQENVSTLQALRRQLGCMQAPCAVPHEKRYPYLDRDLLEFLYAVPRDQMVRPRQRRSLVRRALRSLVPTEILNRRRKAYVTRSPVVNAVAYWSRLTEACPEMLGAMLGIIDNRTFAEDMEKARQGRQVRIVAMMRYLVVEGWLRQAMARQLMPLSLSAPNQAPCLHTAIPGLVDR